MFSKKHVTYDRRRSLLLALLGDQDNLYVLNIPEDCGKDPEAVLTRGEFIAYKLSGKPWKRADSSADPYYRVYLQMEPLDLSPLGSEKIEELLSAAKARAPKLGKETRRKRTPKPSVAPAPKKEYYGAHEVFTNEKGAPYIHAEKPCSECNETIKGYRRVSCNEKGEYSRAQVFEAWGKSRKVADSPGQWLCESCVAGKEVPMSNVEETSPVLQDGDEEIRSGHYTFIRRGNTYLYRGELVKSKTINFRGTIQKSYWIDTSVPCQYCDTSIPVKIPIYCKDGVPLRPGNSAPIQKDAGPIKPNSRVWAHVYCVTRRTEQVKSPKPVEVEEVAPPQAVEVEPSPPQAVEVEPQPDVPEPTPPVHPPAAEHHHAEQPPAMSLIKKMKEMALDPTINSDVYRGAAYMLFLQIGGDDE